MQGIGHRGLARVWDRDVTRRRSHPPVGPNRWVRIVAGSYPSEISRSAVRSTNAVGPQTKLVDGVPERAATVRSISASIRRENPDQAP